MRVIQAKITGKHLELKPAAEPRETEVVDLMERLRRSLAQSGGGKARVIKAPARGVKGTRKRRAKSAA